MPATLTYFPPKSPQNRAVLIGNGGQIEIVHRSTRRGHYAAGAVFAAVKTDAAKPGLYGMADVLDLPD